MHETTDNTMPRLLTPAQLAQALGLDMRTIRRMRSNGQIPVIWAGQRRPRFAFHEVVEALKANPPEGKHSGQ